MNSRISPVTSGPASSRTISAAGEPCSDAPATRLTADQLLGFLKAAGEPTRLRILSLLADGDLSVKDLTQILVQSQPRISRHLKLLSECGLIEGFKEGSWVFYRWADHEPGRQFLGQFFGQLLTTLAPDDPLFSGDQDRARLVRTEKARCAQDYFDSHVADWDRIRSLHVDDAIIEQALLDQLGTRRFGRLVDLGTGTGRMLELLADRIRRGIGIDINTRMLALARSRLSETGQSHCQLRHGDLYNLPLEDETADLVILHQVLHFLDQPGPALTEASRILRPGGLLLVIDFMPHDLEALRTDYAHQRLGFQHRQITGWLEAAGLHKMNEQEFSAPGSGNNTGLSIGLWTASKPHAAAERQRADHQTETTSAAHRTNARPGHHQTNLPTNSANRKTA